jgi:hypothetical protein
MKVPALFENSPTTVHDIADGHEAPFRKVFFAPATGGVVWTVHAVPSQRSTSATSWLAPLLPAAVHAVADEQDTPLRRLAPLTPGVVWIVQVLPFQPIASI